MTSKFIPSLEAYHSLIEETELDYLRRRVKELESKAFELSWKINPDRMGGSFSQDEIDSATAWR